MIWEKFKSASKEDANQFFDWEKSRPTSNEDENQFLNWENPDLHLMKMQISFLIKKRYDNKQIFEKKKKRSQQ